MKKRLTALVSMMALCLLVSGAYAKEEGKKGGKGEALFKKNCATCHPDGGNIMNAKKTLSKKDLEANKLKGSGDIVKYLRNPGPGMTKYDAKTLPDKDAKAVAEYVLKTFK